MADPKKKKGIIDLVGKDSKTLRRQLRETANRLEDLRSRSGDHKAAIRGAELRLKKIRKRFHATREVRTHAVRSKQKPKIT